MWLDQTMTCFKQICTAWKLDDKVQLDVACVCEILLYSPRHAWCCRCNIMRACLSADVCPWFPTSQVLRQVITGYCSSVAPVAANSATWAGCLDITFTSEMPVATVKFPGGLHHDWSINKDMRWWAWFAHTTIAWITKQLTSLYTSCLANFISTSMTTAVCTQWLTQVCNQMPTPFWLQQTNLYCKHGTKIMMTLPIQLASRKTAAFRSWLLPDGC